MDRPEAEQIVKREIVRRQVNPAVTDEQADVYLSTFGVPALTRLDSGKVV